MEPGSRDLSMDRDMSVGRSVSMERTANRASGMFSFEVHIFYYLTDCGVKCTEGVS